jgi:lipid A 4'-phosphatase
MWTPHFAFESDEHHDDEEAEGRPAITAIDMLKGSLMVGAIALAIFVFAPGIDLAIGHLFYAGNRQFIGNQLALFWLARQGFNVFFYLTCVITLLGLIMAARTASTWLGLGVRKWLFVALCLITGPLVVANIGFKDHWGRARPRDVVEFGGGKAFTAAFPPSNQCEYNCSFVSGEASSVFIVLFAAALLFRSRSRKFVALAIVLGGLSGLTRMAQGGHFLSDIVFAGVLMAITAGAIQLLFDTLEAEPFKALEQGSA